MVKHEVPFIGTTNLLFSWRNLNAFFDEFKIETLEDFDTFYKENSSKLKFTDITKIVSFGLQRKDKAVDTEEVTELIDQYLEDKSLQELIELVVRAQMAAMITTPSKVGEVKGEPKKPPKQLKS